MGTGSKLRQFKSMKKEQGFTLVELIVVVAIIAMIAIYVTIEINQSNDDAKLALATAFLASSMPNAISSYRARNLGSCRNIGDNAEDTENLPSLPAGDTGSALKQRLVKRGLAPTTPWDGFWNATTDTSDTSIITVTYPVPSSDQMADARADLTANLEKITQVLSVNNTGTDITVTYSCS